jgi:6-phosphofructokinase
LLTVEANVSLGSHLLLGVKVVRLGLFTGGGDCPGLNAAIRAVVKHGVRNHGMTIVGIENSINGLLDKPYAASELTLESVTEILTRGGTILGTYNRGDPLLGPDGEEMTRRVLQAVDELKLDGLVVIGGEGTQGTSCHLVEQGVKILGIPKTIDNDLPGCDQTIGFSTCVDIVAESVVRLQSTAESHDRVMVLEVMGRDSGYIAMYGGVTGGANVVLIPEIPFSFEAIVEKLNERKALGRIFSVIVVSEGATPKGKKQLFSDTVSGKRLGGVGQVVAQELHRLTGMDTRVTVLGHLQRGGEPNPTDRLLATQFGVQAVELAAAGQWNRLVTFENGRVSHREFDLASKWTRKKIQPNDQVLLSAEAIGINFGR